MGDSSTLPRSRHACVGVLPASHDGDRHKQRRRALSPRERQVLSLVQEGLGNRKIAERLGIGEETVKTLLSRIFRKLGRGPNDD
jgi:DNA-binding NarL/FixJ family response regulator